MIVSHDSKTALKIQQLFLNVALRCFPLSTHVVNLTSVPWLISQDKAYLNISSDVFGAAT